MNCVYQHVYLAPHYDDATLSCGGLIHQQVQADQPVLVVTVCAAPPDSSEPLSPLAQSQHRQWGDPLDIVATRQAEDQAAMRILGADYLRLRFTDCIYRGEPRSGHWYYLGEADLFGEVYPADRAVANDIVEAILELVPAGDGTTLYAPLTAGHHVDHQLTNLAAWQLGQRGCRLAFYEDYPYVDPHFAAKYHHTDPVALAARQQLPLRAQVHRLSPEDLAAKIESLRAYSSQIPVLFGSLADMAACVRNYACYVGGGQLAERVWA
jgi:LmbE family N-acetylglucosaminyl deacetylase